MNYAEFEKSIDTLDTFLNEIEAQLEKGLVPNDYNQDVIEMLLDGVAPVQK